MGLIPHVSRQRSWAQETSKRELKKRKKGETTGRYETVLERSWERQPTAAEQTSNVEAHVLWGRGRELSTWTEEVPYEGQGAKEA